MDAIAHLETARELEPGNPSVYASLAKAYRRQGDLAARRKKPQDPCELKSGTSGADRFCAGRPQSKLCQVGGGAIGSEGASLTAAR